jgi:hypothetical protein
MAKTGDGDATRLNGHVGVDSVDQFAGREDRIGAPGDRSYYNRRGGKAVLMRAGGQR